MAVQPADRAKFLGRFGMSLSEPPSPVEDDDVARIIGLETPTFQDIKTLMRGVRYHQGYDERFEYANSLLPEAPDYLRGHTLRALVRADISADEAALSLAQNKAFFYRLVDLLPSLVGFFGEEARSENPTGIVMGIDDCHHDFSVSGNALRRDRQLREAKEKLARAARLARDAASALSDAEGHFKHDYSRYREAHFRPVPGPTRFLDDLIEELEMCGGVLEIVHAIADIQPKRLFVFGNDQRMSLVEKAYHMCTMWGGPKLVTTPGSDFATLCSLLFEAASGNIDEGLAGAINRYARSEDRKQWDREGEEDYDDDNFQSEKNRMAFCLREIELCKRLQQKAGLSDMAQLLLIERIERDKQQHEESQTRYGPRQVYLSQMSEEQWEGILADAISRWKPEQVDDLDDLILRGKTLATRDIERGQRVRADRESGVDTKSES